MSASILALRPPPPSIFPTPIQPRRRRAAISANLGGADADPLLRASLRFQESLRPDPLFVDQHAGCFIDSDTKQQPINVNAYTVATKFIDDRLLSLMSSNEDLRQIVLLSGGMDTRPYRLTWPRSCVIYDVSPGSVFTFASQRLAGIGAKIPRSCLLRHVPIESSDLQSILCMKGFNGSRPSVWVLQGLPLMPLASLTDLLYIISSLAIKGSTVIGELPKWLLRTEFGNMSSTQEALDKLFMNNAFKVDLVDFDEVARDLHVDSLPGENENVLFIAKQLRLSDAQMESWRTHLERIDEEADEEGFEEL